MVVGKKKVGGKATPARTPVAEAALDPQELRTLAQKHFQAGRFAEVLATLDAAERAHPPTPAALKMRTLALIKSGRPEEAAELLPRLAAVERSDEAWLRCLGRIAAKLNAWQTANEAWSKVQALAPGDPECLHQLLRARAALGDHRGTLSASLELLSLGSDDEEALRAAAHASARLGALHRARDLAHRLIAQDAARAWEWLETLEGPWWTLIAAEGLAAADAEVLERQRTKLLAAGLSKGMMAEVRGDWLTAYAAFRAAVVADEGNGDARDGLKRARAGLHALLASSGGAPSIAVHDALAAVFADEAFMESWHALFERLAREADWSFAKAAFKESVPAPLLAPFLSRLRQHVLDKFKEGHEHVAHFCELYVMIEPGDDRIRAIHGFVTSGTSWMSAVRGW